MKPSTHRLDVWSLRLGGHRECEVLHIRIRTETESKKDAYCPERRHPDESPSRKYGRTAADALPKPRCDMRCPEEPQLEQGEGHEEDGDTGDIATRTVSVARPAWARAPGAVSASSVSTSVRCTKAYHNDLMAGFGAPQSSAHRC